MAAYRVTFDQDVTYLPGHPTGQRSIRTMDVYADDPIDARDHALRTTVGGRVESVECVGTVHPSPHTPLPEAPEPDPRLAEGWVVGG